MVMMADIYDNYYFGGGGGIPAQPPITTPATPSTPVSYPSTTAGSAIGTNPNTMSLFDIFRNINNRTQYQSGPAATGPVSIPAFQGGGGPAYSPMYLGTKEALLNPKSGTSQVQGSIASFLDPNGAYLQNARQRGVEQAAMRGGVNSSIAGGASERAAMEAIQPFVQQAVDVDQQKYKLMAEDYLAQQGYVAQDKLADKSNAMQAAIAQYNGGLQMALAQQRANTDNWLSEQNFGRALFGQTFSNSMGMLNMIQQYGLEDPELYTPEVLSGYTNFFQQNMNDLLGRYFGGN